jgi:hypothetical protein
MHRTVGRAFQLTLFILGFALSVVGVLYLITPVEALPSFLGGMHREGLRAGAYHTKRADVALILGVLALITSGWLFARSARLRRSPSLPGDPLEGWKGDPSEGWKGAPLDPDATRT